MLIEEVDHLKSNLTNIELKNEIGRTSQGPTLSRAKHDIGSGSFAIDKLLLADRCELLVLPVSLSSPPSSLLSFGT